MFMLLSCARTTEILISEIKKKNETWEKFEVLFMGIFIFWYHNDPKHTANASEIIFGEKNS